MALSITPVAGGGVWTARIAWPSLFEAFFTLAAIAALFPLFETLSANVEGRDARFGAETPAISRLPPRVLPTLCNSHGGLAEPALRARLCAGIASRSNVAAVDRMPAALLDASVRIKAAFAAPLRDAQARADLRLHPRQAVGEPLQSADPLDARLRRFVERYSLDVSNGAAPLPLACAYELVGAALSRTAPTRVTDSGMTARANAVLLLAAAMDGDLRTDPLAGRLLLPEVSRAGRQPCAGDRLAEALSKASAVMADARHASLNGAKNEAMRELVRSAGSQWSAAMLAGLLLLNLSRRPEFTGFGVAVALATWAVLAWLGRVPWPFATERAFVPARETLSPYSTPAWFILGLLALAIVAASASLAFRTRLRSTPQTIASRVGYPGFVVATGLGSLLLLDLSANGNVGNRYLALYHQGHLWFGMLVLNVIAFARQPLGRWLAWTLAMLDGLANSVRRRLGAMRAATMAILITALLIGAFGALLTNLRQVTSEIGRLWLMLGAAWFFFLRGAPFAERLARSGTSLGSLMRYVAPLAFVVVVLIGAMVLTHDMGPLLIAGYGAGAFLAASASMWMHQRFGLVRTAYLVAVAVFVVWIALVTLALFQIGSIDDVTAARLENVAAPLASANDQLALVTWFQQVTPQAGFGLGAVPWCGYGGSTGCAGVPAQIQSDYTFTAIVGAFGATAAWAVTLGCALWLHRLVSHHGRVTSGEPRFVGTRGRIANDEQAFLSWLAVAWVVLTLCQLAVTVAGNLAVIPLTGVTFPFVSFGMTSLLVNTALFALCVNVNVAGRVRA